MSILAATTLAAVLAVSPGGSSFGASSASDAARLATNGGFLLGSAHRCGIAGQRLVQAGQLIRALIEAAAADAHEQEEATTQFARFFIVSAALDSKSATVVPSCPKVVHEFARLEQHNIIASGSGKSGGRTFRLGDGD
ncbi:MAG: hypothetical protein ACM3JG_10385 [Thiohalocapsa sp.]